MTKNQFLVLGIVGLCIVLIEYGWSQIHTSTPEAAFEETTFEIRNDQTVVGEWNRDAKGGIEFHLNGLARFADHKGIGYVGTSATLVQKDDRHCCQPMQLTAREQTLLARCNQDTNECEPVKWWQLPEISYANEMIE